jgi:hypothetical protein
MFTAFILFSRAAAVAALVYSDIAVQIFMNASSRGVTVIKKNNSDLCQTHCFVDDCEDVNEDEECTRFGANGSGVHPVPCSSSPALPSSSSQLLDMLAEVAPSLLTV